VGGGFIIQCLYVVINHVDEFNCLQSQIIEFKFLSFVYGLVYALVIPTLFVENDVINDTMVAICVYNL